VESLSCSSLARLNSAHGLIEIAEAISERQITLAQFFENEVEKDVGVHWNATSAQRGYFFSLLY
jgi:hypothetical protein